MNGLAAWGVVFHHAANLAFRSIFEYTSRYQSVTVPIHKQLGSMNYTLLLIVQLDNFTLPTFMFISGFFVAFAFAKNLPSDWKVVLLRVKYLLIPAILWNIIHFLLLLRLPSSPFEPIGTYYYITLLVQYYLLSPLMVSLVKTRWKLLLIVSAMQQLGWVGVSILGVFGGEWSELVQTMMFILRPRIWLVPNLIFWFVLGIVAGVHRQQLTQWLASVKRYLLIAVPVLGLLTMVEYAVLASLAGKAWLGPTFAGFSGTLYAFTFIMCFLAFDEVSLPFFEELSQLGSKSLGIYLANIPAMYVLSIMIDYLAPWVLGYQLIYPVALIVVGMGIPLLLMSLVRKSPARWAYRYVFG